MSVTSIPTERESTDSLIPMQELWGEEGAYNAWRAYNTYSMVVTFAY